MKTILCFALACMVTFMSFSQIWQELSPVPSDGRDDAVAFSVHGFGYLVTGNLGGFSQSNRLWQYDPQSGSWAEKAVFPGTPRQYAGAFVIDGKAYVVAGISEASVPLNDVWKYDPAADQWMQMSDFPGLPRWSVFAAAANGRGYMGTGTTLTALLSDAWEYDPEADSWTSLPEFPGGARRETVAFGLGEKICVGLGFDQLNGTGLRSDFYAYNQLSQTWQQLQDFPGGTRAYAVGMSTDSYGYAGTGYDETGAYQSDMFRFNPVSAAWEIIAQELPVPGIRGMSAFAVKDTPFFLTGLKTGPERTSSMWKLGGEPGLKVIPLCYPNPSSGTVVARSQPGSAVFLYSLQGKLMRKLVTDGFSTLLTGIPAGTYILLIETDGVVQEQLLFVY